MDGLNKFIYEIEVTVPSQFFQEVMSFLKQGKDVINLELVNQTSLLQIILLNLRLKH